MLLETDARVANCLQALSPLYSILLYYFFKTIKPSPVAIDA
jgi:hypothetical protein